MPIDQIQGETTMKKFETGKSYFGRMVGDADQIIRVTVAKRTASMLTTAEGKRFKIKTSYDSTYEYILPLGNYSMAPHITAEKETA